METLPGRQVALKDAAKDVLDLLRRTPRGAITIEALQARYVSPEGIVKYLISIGEVETIANYYIVLRDFKPAKAACLN